MWNLIHLRWFTLAFVFHWKWGYQYFEWLLGNGVKDNYCYFGDIKAGYLLNCKAKHFVIVSESLL